MAKNMYHCSILWHCLFYGWREILSYLVHHAALPRSLIIPNRINTAIFLKPVCENLVFINGDISIMFFWAPLLFRTVAERLSFQLASVVLYGLRNQWCNPRFHSVFEHKSFCCWFPVLISAILYHSCRFSIPHHAAQSYGAQHRHLCMRVFSLGSFFLAAVKADRVCLLEFFQHIYIYIYIFI